MIIAYPLETVEIGHDAPEFEFEVEPTGADVYEYCVSLAKSSLPCNYSITKKVISDGVELVLDSMGLWPTLENDKGFREFVGERYARQARSQYEFECKENGTCPLDFE